MFIGNGLLAAIRFGSSDRHNYFGALFRTMHKCTSGKRLYASAALAEEALIEAHIHFAFERGKGPVAYYLCGECGQFHLTSQGPMNERLVLLIKSGELRRLKEACAWERKLRKQ
jgi:hypothetical protein